jgi:hypothetical protein
MKRILSVFLLLLGGVCAAQEPPRDQQVEETLRALPEALRDGATVVGYENGEQKVIRPGSGFMICWADDPASADAPGAFYVTCFPKSLQAFVERFEELRGNPEQVAIMEAEVKSGQLAVPRVAMRYTLRGAEAEGGVPLGVLHIPFATAADAEEMGFSTVPDNFRPWLMWEGSPMAHVMFPGN